MWSNCQVYKLQFFRTSMNTNRNKNPWGSNWRKQREHWSPAKSYWFLQKKECIANLIMPLFILSFAKFSVFQAVTTCYIKSYQSKKWVVKHVRLHWNSWRWSYCFMYESFKNTELPEKKCQHSTEIPEGETFSNTICPEGKNPTLF